MGKLTYQLPLLLFAVAGAVWVHPTYAHGFGERYDLPMPLEYYLAGAAAVVALSFLIITLFMRRAPGSNKYWRLNLLDRRPFATLLRSRLFTVSIELTSVFLFLLVMATGIWGDQRPGSNFSPTFIWIIWWVGMGFCAALVGNLWIATNPWSVIYRWAESMYKRLNPGGELDFGYEYPHWIGIWPAFTIFFGFAWLETSFPHSAIPSKIAMLIAAYSLITWGGMLLFGRHVWLRQTYHSKVS